MVVKSRPALWLASWFMRSAIKTLQLDGVKNLIHCHQTVHFIAPHPSKTVDRPLRYPFIFCQFTDKIILL
jgi:hypothetical protein